MTQGKQIAPQDVEQVLAQYDIGRSADARLPGGGTANLNTVIETDRGRFFLRRRNLKYCTDDQLVFDHDLMRHLAAKAVPGPLPLKTRDGRTWVRLQSETFELHRFVAGGPHDRGNLEQIKSAARELALFHLAVLDFKTKASKAWPRYDSPFLIRAGLADLAKRGCSSHQDDLDYVRRQVALLEKELPDKRYASLPRYVIHGDYHPANMLFNGNAVAGIFDLDWASRQPRLRDIADGVVFYAAERATDIDGASIVSLTQAMTYNRERIHLFLSTYHHALRIKPEEMAVLPQFLRARWLHCRVAGLTKVPDERKEAYFFNEIRVPLQWIEEHEGELSALPG